MKTLIAALWLCSFVPGARALTWGDLETGGTYGLKIPLRLKSQLTLSAGSAVRLLERISLDPVAVILFEFQLLNCPASLAAQKSEIVIVQGRYGAELEVRCRLNGYVETRDFFQDSWLAVLRPASVL